MAAIALLAAVGVQLAMPSGVDLPVTARATPRPVREAVESDPPVYTAIMAHPIFAPDRAPPPAEAEVSGNLNGVEVLGTAIEGKTAAAALLRDSGGGFSRVRIGEVIEGWKLVTIEPTELIFDRNGERRSLSVDVTRPKATTTGADKSATQGLTRNSTSDSDDSDDNDDSDQ